MTDLTYPHLHPLAFAGLGPVGASLDKAQAVVLPAPLDRTTSFVAGTRSGPRELLMASTQLDWWDEELALDVHDLGIVTLPEMEFPYATLESAVDAISEAAADILKRNLFLLTLGGEHTVTPAVIRAVAGRWPGLSVLQIDAHADLRNEYLGQRWSHACAMRRTLEFASLVQVGIRSISEQEWAELPTLNTKLFLDWNMREDPDWMDRVVDGLGDPVYITVDMDGFDPATMPAVGTPEPGGLTWREVTRLLRKVFLSRTVVAADCVELCPVPGIVAPNVLAAKLAYKILTYKLAGRERLAW